MEDLIQSLDRTRPGGTGMLGQAMGMLNTGQRKGFLYGVGTAVLFYLLWPSARTNMRSIAVRSIEEGMSMVDRAKSFVDGQYPPPPQDFTNFDPPSPPQEGTPPPYGDNPQE